MLRDRLVLGELVEARVRAGIGGDLLRVAAGIGERGGLHSGYVVAQTGHDAAILDLESDLDRLRLLACFGGCESRAPVARFGIGHVGHVHAGLAFDGPHERGIDRRRGVVRILGKVV